MTQLILLYDCSRSLRAAVEHDGPFLCTTARVGSVYLRKPPVIAPLTGLVPLRTETTEEINRCMALSCDYDTSVSGQDVLHALQQLAVAIQLVKPSRLFLDLWLQLDADRQVDSASTSIRDLGFLLGGPNPYLRYQEQNTIEEADVKRALGLLPNLAIALDRSRGSWEHPVLSIHRAVIFLCQGYAVRPDDPSQFLWAAGLDCLFASKLDRRKQGSTELSGRIAKLFGAVATPYDSIRVPTNQQPRRRLQVREVALDIFKLRNAFAHGRPMPNPDWLSDPGSLEGGYAYQLLEQTEILLRLSLLRILQERGLFETFADSSKLDAFF